MASAQVVKKSVANNSASRDDDQIIKVIYYSTKVGDIKPQLPLPMHKRT